MDDISEVHIDTCMINDVIFSCDQSISSDQESNASGSNPW